MPDGTMTPPEVITGVAPSEFKTPEPKRFTPLPDELMSKPPEYRSTMTEPPKHEEANIPEMPDMNNMPPDLQRLMNDIKQEATKGQGQTEVLPSIDNLRNQAAKKEIPKGLFAQIIEWFKTTFRNLFR
jgi:hypothetical protein